MTLLADDIESDLIENVIDKDSELLGELLYEFAKTWDDIKHEQQYSNLVIPSLYK
tara:strand:- start:524 stop:688 length:165 start_codon:yes stop_codon:yes gene_type:complete